MKLRFSDKPTDEIKQRIHHLESALRALLAEYHYWDKSHYSCVHCDGHCGKGDGEYEEHAPECPVVQARALLEGEA